MSNVLKLYLFYIFMQKKEPYSNKIRFLLKKDAEIFGGSKKTAYLCIAIKGKAPWLN